MKLLYTSAAALALTAAGAAAQEAYGSSAAGNMAGGYTTQAMDTVPGAAVSSAGEMPEAESGATADAGATSNTDYAAEPEADAQAGVDLDTMGADTETPLTDPAEPVDTADADTADATQDEVAGGMAGVMGAETTPSTEQFDAEQAAAQTMTEERRAEGWESMQLSELTVDDLTGATVVDTNYEDIGYVSELVINTSGELTEAELAIGGFVWGIGATDVLVSMDDLMIQRNNEAREIEVFVDMTEDALIERADQG